MTLAQFFDTVYPLLLNRTIEKVEKTLTDGTTVKAYWAGAVVRVDIKPLSQ